MSDITDINNALELIKKSPLETPAMLEIKLDDKTILKFYPKGIYICVYNSSEFYKYSNIVTVRNSMSELYIYYGHSRNMDKIVLFSLDEVSHQDSANIDNLNMLIQKYWKAHNTK